MLWDKGQDLDLVAWGEGEKYLVHTISINYPLQLRNLPSVCFPRKTYVCFVMNMKIHTQFKWLWFNASPTTQCLWHCSFFPVSFWYNLNSTSPLPRFFVLSPNSATSMPLRDVERQHSLMIRSWGLCLALLLTGLNNHYPSVGHAFLPLYNKLHIFFPKSWESDKRVQYPWQAVRQEQHSYAWKESSETPQRST